MQTTKLATVSADRQLAFMTGGVTYAHRGNYDGPLVLKTGMHVLVDDGDLEPVEAVITQIDDLGLMTLELLTARSA